MQSSRRSDPTPRNQGLNQIRTSLRVPHAVLRTPQGNTDCVFPLSDNPQQMHNATTHPTGPRPAWIFPVRCQLPVPGSCWEGSCCRMWTIPEEVPMAAQQPRSPGAQLQQVTDVPGSGSCSSSRRLGRGGEGVAASMAAATPPGVGAVPPLTAAASAAAVLASCCCHGCRSLGCSCPYITQAPRFCCSCVGMRHLLWLGVRLTWKLTRLSGAWLGCNPTFLVTGVHTCKRCV